MNWFTKNFVSSKSLEEKTDLINRDIHNFCDHVAEDNNNLYVVAKENDSFGYEATGLCKECWDQTVEEAENETVRCMDCKEYKKKRDVLEWTWYDFYAAQGDEPCEICNDCWSKEKHQQRMAMDRRTVEEELYPCRFEEEDED